MSVANPVSAAVAKPILAAIPNPATPALGAKVKAVAEIVWSVVKTILIAAGLVAGAAAGAALLGFVTIALSPALLIIAAVVGAMALLYLGYKGCQKASKALSERKFRNEVTKLAIDHPAIAKRIQDLYTRKFDRIFIFALVNMDKANEHLKAELKKNQSPSFAVISNMMNAHLDAELNKIPASPTSSIPDYCQSEQAIVDYVKAAAEKRDSLIACIDNLNKEKVLPARVNQAAFLAMVDKVAKRLETKLNQLDKGVPQYLQGNLHLIDPYVSVPGYCENPNTIVSYVEKLIENLTVIDQTIATIEVIIEANKHKERITSVNDLVKILKEKKTHLDLGIQVSIPEFYKNKDLLASIPEFCKDKNLTAQLIIEFLEKSQLVKRTITVLTQEIQNKQVISKEDQRVVAAAKKIKAAIEQLKMTPDNSSIPGYCYYSGKDYLANVTVIAHKQERVEKAIQHIKTTAGIAVEVDQFFQNRLAKLQKGVNAPLPDYFHATTYVESIIKSKEIWQSSNGMLGRGTYMSNNNEGNFGYGPYAFAIDEDCLVDTSAFSLYARLPYPALKETYHSTWIAVHKNVTISNDTIAFLDTRNLDIPHLRDLLKKQGLNTIEVITRDTSDGIRKVFDAIRPQREAPSFSWLLPGRYPVTNMPVNNMIPRTV